MNMIERVARAIADDFNLAPYWVEYAMPWNEYTLAQKACFIRAARAAIAAMREPTDLLDVGNGTLCSLVRLPELEDRRGDVREIWQSMIDAALKEGEA